MTSDFKLTPSPHPGAEADCAFWPTPRWATLALLDAFPLDTTWVIEPSAGQGAIAEVLAERGHQVIAIERREECLLLLHRTLLRSSQLHRVVIGDWLTTEPSYHVPPMVAFSIAGNPPYNPAEDMLAHVKRAVTCGARNVALLLPTNFLHSKARAAFHKEHPLSIMFALARRPSQGGMRDLSWFVWSDTIGPQMKVEVIA